MPSLLPELPLESAEALAKAALLEDVFPTQVLIATGTRPEALDPLFDHGLLEETRPSEACLLSPEAGAQVLKTLAWSQKRKMSHGLAEACLKLSLDAGLIGRLYLQAQRFRAAREQFVQAAEDACTRYAYRDALNLMRAALDIWPNDDEPDKRRDFLRQMARCAGTCSDHETTRFAWEELLEAADEGTPPAERVDLVRHLAQASKLQGDRLHSRELLQRAATLAEDSGLVAEGAHLWRLLAQEQGDALRLHDAMSSVARAHANAESIGDSALLSDSLAYEAMLAAMLGRLQDARLLLDRAMNLAIEDDLPEQITNAYRRQANISEYSSAYRTYRDTELAALDRCRTRGETSGTQACLSCVAYAFFRLGQFDESLAAISEAIEGPGLEGELRVFADAVSACIHAARGEGSNIAREIDEAHHAARTEGTRVVEFYLLWAKGAQAMLRQETETAAASFHALIEFWHDTDDRKDVVPGLVSAASFFADQNDASQLAQCLDILHSIEAETEAAEPGYGFLAASAEEAWLNGQSDAAIERFKKACQGYHELQLRFEEAWLGWRLGYVQSESGQVDAAEETWRKADAIIRQLGLKPLGWAVTRARRKSVSAAPPPLLTPRQRDVARLIAAGRTNKEAASELGLSPRTVEMHVAALLDRLGCRSRAEAVRRAAELGLLSE